MRGGGGVARVARGFALLRMLATHAWNYVYKMRSITRILHEMSQPRLINMQISLIDEWPVYGIISKNDNILMAFWLK